MPDSVRSATFPSAISRRNWIRMASASILFPFFPGWNEAQLPPPLLAAATWAGTKLLQQAASYIGGAILSEAFNNPSIADVKGWVQDSVAEVESSIAKLSDKIDAFNLNQMTSGLESLKRQFMEYVLVDPSKQQQNRPLLANCDALSAGLIPLAQHYDQAFQVATVAMGYRLATLFALYQLDNDGRLDKNGAKQGSGHVKLLAVDGEVDTFFQRSTAARQRILASMLPEKHGSLECSYEASLLPFRGPTTNCQVLLDGQAAANSGPMQWDSGLSVLEVRRETVAKTTPLLRSVLKHQSENYQSFRDQSRTQIQLVWQCFDRMYLTACNARYQPPREVSQLSWALIHLDREPTVKWIK